MSRVPRRAARTVLRGGGRCKAPSLPDPENALLPEDRAELEDYARSGYDRGHMTPSGDMPDAAAQAQSFSLANIVPQAPKLNRGIWERIESAVRRRAERAGELYVITGSVFEGANLQAVHGRVLVPTATYKAVYDPAAGAAGTYVCTNTNEPECRVVSVAELVQFAGIDPFPAVPESVKAIAARLPVPKPRRLGHGRARDPQRAGDKAPASGGDPFATTR